MLFVICIHFSMQYLLYCQFTHEYDSYILRKFHQSPYCRSPIISNDFSKHMNEISPTYFFMVVVVEVLVWWREFVMAVPGAPANSGGNVHRNVSHELSHHWLYFPHVLFKWLVDYGSNCSLFNYSSFHFHSN